MSIKILNEFPGEIEVRSKWHDDDDPPDVYDSFGHMLREGDFESGTIGPFKFELVASEGGEGKGEYACRVYKITDQRDESFQHVALVGSYYSYNGYEWDGAEPVLCSIEQRTVSKVVTPNGTVVADIG